MADLALGQTADFPLFGWMPARTLAAGLSNTPREALRIDGFGKKGKEPKMMDIGFHGLWGVLILAGDIWAILNIFQSSVSNEKKLIWIIAVVLLPLLGLILWYFLGPRSSRAQ